jgi:hypothetical protein
MTSEFSDSKREQIDRQICDGADCNDEATKKIEVSAGKHGIIELSVCKNCVSKFQEDKG